MFKPLTPAQLYSNQLKKLSTYKNKKSKDKAKVKFKDARAENKIKIKKYNIYQSDVKKRNNRIKNSTTKVKNKVANEWNKYQQRKTKHPKKSNQFLDQSKLKIKNIYQAGKMDKIRIKDNFNIAYNPVILKDVIEHRNNTKHAYVINDTANWRTHIDELLSKHKNAHNIIVGQKINYEHDVTNMISESYTYNELVDATLMGSDIFVDQIENIDKSKYHITIKSQIYFANFYIKN